MLRFFILLLSLFLFFPQAANAGLVGWWKMDEASWNGTANEVVDSAGANHGTSSGGATTKVGKIDRAGNFDGVNDYVDLGNPAALQITGAITLSAWVYIAGYSATAFNSRIVSKLGASTNQGWDLTRESSDDKLYFSVAIDASTRIRVSSINTSIVSRWVHYTGVYEPSVALRLYIDGVLDNENTTSVPASQRNSTINAMISRHPFSSSNTYLYGIIDDVRIYNHALTANEVAELYYAGANTRIRNATFR